jgi:fermentation-respiration switch protein FrsA (DUF1100 family)
MKTIDILDSTLPILGSKDKELFPIKDASHMDLYDGKQYVPQVVGKLLEFVSKNL